MILDIVQCFIMVNEVGVIKLTVRSLNCTCILDRKLRFLLTENQFFFCNKISGTMTCIVNLTPV